MVQILVRIVVLNRLVHPTQYRSYLRRVVPGVPDQGVDGVPERVRSQASDLPVDSCAVQGRTETLAPPGFPVPLTVV